MLNADEHRELLAALFMGACSKSPDGEHEDVTIRDPHTGLTVKMCKHCGRQAS